MITKVYDRRLTEIYLFLSLASSMTLLISLSLFLGTTALYNHGFFIASLVAGNFLFWQFGLMYSMKIVTKYLPHIFLFQSLCFSGMALELHEFSFLFACVIPAFSSFFVYLYKGNRYKGIVLSVIPFLAYLILNHLFRESWQNDVLSLEGIVLAFVTFWIVGMGFLGAYDGKKFMLSKIFSKEFLNYSFGESDKLNNQQEFKQRLFFHDLINQTHGINLYLSYKSSSGIGLNSKECQALEREVKMLQSLVKDHFEFRHKNLGSTYKYVSFKEIKEALPSIVEHFLPDHKVRCEINYMGLISDDQPDSVIQSCYVHQAGFIRIMTNLIKNVSDNGSNDVEINLKYDESGLTIVVMNKIFKLKQDGNNLSENLRNIILDESKIRNRASDYDEIENIGLESVSHLTESLGGKFTCNLDGDFWVTKVFLPVPERYKKGLKAA